MKIYENFTPYTPNSESSLAILNINAEIVFLRAADGSDWYECQKEFSEGTVKIVFDPQSGIVTSFSSDLSTLWPAYCSVAEVLADNVPADLSISGEWVFKDGAIKRRESTTEELIANAEVERNSLMQTATKTLAPYQDAVDLGVATKAEQAMLDAWKLYRVLLNRVDTNDPVNISWPDKPA